MEYIDDKVREIYSRRNRPAAILFTPFANRTDDVHAFALQMKPLGRKFKKNFNFYLEDVGTSFAKLHKFEGNATFIIFDIDEEGTK